jgi:pilus assembly protein CpaF
MTSFWQTVLPGENERRDQLDEIEDAVHQRIIRAVNEAQLRNLDKDESRLIVEQTTRRLLTDEYPQVVGDDKEEVISHVVDEVTGLGPIESLLRDPTVSEVMVNGPTEVFCERNGIIEEAGVAFKNAAHIMRIVDRITTALGRHIDEATPMVDARLVDGSRVNVIIPPLVPDSPVMTIRKFRADLFSMPELVQTGTITGPMAEFLAGCVRAKLNIVVSGGTGSGKTTLLNALSSAIPSRERVISIEDPLELRLQQKHVIKMEARPPSVEGGGEITQRMLLRNALRMRPDRIIIGEVRGSEAFDMMQAMNTGHEGSLTTVHANSPRDALARIENMVMMAGFELPLHVIREQMGSALHLVVHLSRLYDGTRRVVNVSEIAGLEGNIITMQDIFLFHQDGISEDGRVIGELRPTGLRPQFSDRLKSFGVELSADVFGVARWA